jgi:hypothetical protein
VPEVEHSALTAQEARAEHRVGFAFHDRAQQLAELHRVVFEIRVLHHDDVTTGPANPFA